MESGWLFKKLNVGLRTEVIINISLLMLAAILLIGFTISKVNEKGILEEKIRYGHGVVQDFQTMIDFLMREKKDLALSHFAVKKELQDFVRIYGKGKGFDQLVITDHELQVIVSRRANLEGKSYSHEPLRKAIQTGQAYTEIEKSGGFFWTQYKRWVVCSPLWIQGKVAGGIQMEIPIGDMMVHVLESQRWILISIILDAIILIVFGSFLLSRVLVNPLKELIRLTEKISAGDFNDKIEVSSKNEMGQLIVSFNRMIERLKENKESLENYLQNLETANRKLKQAHEELIRTEKLASIGRFAAGVAHEVGNPLGAILGYTSILEKEGIPSEESKDYLRRIQHEIERINRIVRELLDFARPSRFEVKDVQLNKVIENTLSLLSYQKNFRSVETRLELQPDLPMIKGDESHLSQVLINIILNALDAMPNGGTLTIKTEEYRVGELFPERLRPVFSPRRKEDPRGLDYSHMRKPDPLSAILVRFSKGDQVVRARISDTGIGIKKDDLERIFDPFFTTKAPDRGTGLGLSISLRILESMGGEIRVESEVGIGSAFELYFPVSN